MMWVSIVRIEADQDPGQELVTALRERFGESVRTQTQAGWLYDETRKPPPPFGKVSPNMGTIRTAKLRKSTR